MPKVNSQGASAGRSPNSARQASPGLAAGGGPSTRRGRRKRAELIRAAREVFEEVGFKDARIADIATRAGTSYGSFYFYFESKEAIFRDVVTEFTGQMFQVSRVGASAGTDPVQRIESANRAYLAAYRQNARLLAVLEEVSAFDAHFRELNLEIRNLFVQRNEQGILRLQEQGLADPHLDAKIAASALGGMVEKFAQVWLIMGEEYDEAEVIETLTRVWAHGIGLKLPDRAVTKSAPGVASRGQVPVARRSGQTRS